MLKEYNTFYACLTRKMIYMYNIVYVFGKMNIIIKSNMCASYASARRDYPYFKLVRNNIKHEYISNNN